MLKKILSFTTSVLLIAYNTLKDFVLDIIHNWEALILLSLATIGLTKLLVELPFYIYLPLFVESIWVAPIVATLIVILLVKILEWRMKQCASSVMV